MLTSKQRAELRAQANALRVFYDKLKEAGYADK